MVNPIWEALDEPEHFQYVKFLAEQRRLPRGDELLPSLVDRPPNELFQPPLYYLMEAPFVASLNLNSHISWVRNPYFTWAGHPLRNGVAVHTLTEAWPYQGQILGAHVMRALSSLMGAGAVLLIYLSAATMLPGPFALLAALVAALTPGFLLSSATIDNDNAATLTSALTVFLAIRVLYVKKRQWLAFGALGVAEGLALLSKANTAILLPLGILAALLLFWRERIGRVDAAALRLIARVSILVATIVGTAGTYYLHSERGTGGYLSYYLNDFGASLRQLTLQRIRGVWGVVFETYWGSYGWDVFHLPHPFYTAFKLVTLVAVVGCLFWLTRRLPRGYKSLALSPQAGSVLLLAVALSGSLLSVVLWNILQHDDGATSHARFIFPTLTASSLFIALGLWSLPRILRVAGFASLFALYLAVIGYSFMTLPKAFGPTAPVYGDVQSAGAQHSTNIPFGHAMEIVGWSNSGISPPNAGSQLQLRLFWSSSYTVPAYPFTPLHEGTQDLRALRVLPADNILVRPDFDYSAFVRLAGPNGTVIHDEDHGPGLGDGMLPHAWEPGEVVPDDWNIRIPAGIPSGPYDIQVGLYDYRDGKAITTISGKPFAVLGQLQLG